MKVYEKDIEVRIKDSGDFTVSVAVNDTSLIIKNIGKKDMKKLYYQLKAIFDK